MVGDIVHILDIHRKKGQRIFEHFLKKYKNYNKKIVAIAGVSGTGKTEIGYVLQSLLWEKSKIRSKCLHIDDYYSTSWKYRNDIRKKTGIIGKEEIDWNKLNKVLYSFKNNENKLYVQRIHKYLDAIEYSISPNNSIDVLILEGLYSLYANQFDLGVYLEGSIAETYSFRKMRKKENPDNKFRQEVLKKESACVWQSKNNANLIIPFNNEN